jgi:hypothetical protein
MESYPDRSIYLREKPLLPSIELRRVRFHRAPLSQLAIWNSPLSQRFHGLLDLSGEGYSMLPVSSVMVSRHKLGFRYRYIAEDGPT